MFVYSMRQILKYYMDMKYYVLKYLPYSFQES